MPISYRQNTAQPHNRAGRSLSRRATLTHAPTWKGPENGMLGRGPQSQVMERTDAGDTQHGTQAMECRTAPRNLCDVHRALSPPINLTRHRRKKKENRTLSEGSRTQQDWTRQGSHSAKCPQQASPWRQRADEGWPGAAGNGGGCRWHGVSSGGDGNVLESAAVTVARLWGRAITTEPYVLRRGGGVIACKVNLDKADIQNKTKHENPCLANSSHKVNPTVKNAVCRFLFSNTRFCQD